MHVLSLAQKQPQDLMRLGNTFLPELGPGRGELPLIRSPQLPDRRRLLLKGSFLLLVPLLFRVAMPLLFFMVYFLLLIGLCTCKQRATSQ